MTLFEEQVVWKFRDHVGIVYLASHANNEARTRTTIISMNHCTGPMPFLEKYDRGHTYSSLFCTCTVSKIYCTWIRYMSLPQMRTWKVWCLYY